MFNGNSLSNLTEMTAVNMSDYFPGHPLVNTQYHVTVSAENSRGRGAPSLLTTGECNVWVIKPSIHLVS